MKNKFIYIIFGIFFTTLFLGAYSINSVLLALTSCVSMFYLIKKKNVTLLRSQKLFIFTIILYLIIHLLDYIFYYNFNEKVGASVSKQFLILLIILTFIFIKEYYHYKINLETVFLIFITLSIIPFIVWKFLNIEDSFMLFTIEKLNLERPYYGFLLASAGLMIISNVIHFFNPLGVNGQYLRNNGESNSQQSNPNFFIQPLVYFLLYLLIIFICLKLEVKMALIGLIISSVGVVFIYLNKSMRLKFVLLILISTSILYVSKSSKINDEISSVKGLISGPVDKTTNSNSVLSGQENSFNLRKITWAKTMQKIKQNYVFGIGSLEAEKDLDYYYKTLGYPWMVGQNTHNQFLNQLLLFGILGLVSLLVFMLYPLFLALNNSWYFLFGFNILFICCCLTENMLNRQTGIVSYLFFNSFFIFLNNNIKINNNET